MPAKILPYRGAGTTIQDLADAHLAWLERRVAAGKRKQATLDAARARYRAHVLPYIGTANLQGFSMQQAEAWHLKVSETAPIAANRAASLLSGAWLLAELWGWVPSGNSPWRGLGLFKNPEAPRRKRLSPEQVRALDAYLHLVAEEAPRSSQQRSALAIALILETGCRRGEIEALGRSQVHAGPPAYLELRQTKTVARTVALSDRAVYLLSEAADRADGEPLFLGCFLESVWRKARVEIGAPWCTLHDLRRSFASASGDAGIDLKDAAALTGHKSLAVANDVYRVLSGDRRRELANRTSRALRGEREGA